jgi:SAM-dependent methyltransferase
LIELDAIHDPAAVLRSLARLIGEVLVDPTRLVANLKITREQILANLHGFDLAKLRRGEIEGVDQARLKLHACLLEDAPIHPGSVDVVVSNSVLEHLPDCDAAIAALARITRSGGFGLHSVDTIDHRWYGTPSIHQFEFLADPSEAAIVHGCNRVRLGQYPALFARHGFRVLDKFESTVIAMPEELRRRLVEPWRSMSPEELKHGYGTFVVQKQ